MTLASKITLFRIAIVPVLVAVAAIGFEGWNIAAGILFIIGAISDTVDGTIARKYNQISDFGKLMDPIADKMLLAAAMIILIAWNKLPFYLGMAIIMRDQIVSGFRIVAVQRGMVLAARSSGKIKTLLQCFCYSVYFFNFDIVGHVLLALSVLTTLWSLFDYIIPNKHVISREKAATFVMSFIDKLLISWLVFIAVGIGRMDIVTGMIFIGADIIISGLRVTAVSNGKELPVRISGLVRFAAQLVAIVSAFCAPSVVACVVASVLTALSTLDYAVNGRRA